MTLPTGAMLGQRYEIRAFVGSDGTLDVYKGLDLRLGRSVAVTVLELLTIQQPEKLLRFEKETQARAGLHHPRIVTIHDFGHDAACSYQIAEWLDGQSLRKRLKAGPLSWRECQAIGQAGLEAIEGIHDRGFTLSAIDDTSVFLQTDGEIKLFAYEVRRLEGAISQGFRKAEQGALQALARLLLRGLGDSGPTEHRARWLALKQLSEATDATSLRQDFEKLLWDEPIAHAPPSTRRWIPVLSALLVLLLAALGVRAWRKRASTTAPKVPVQVTEPAEGAPGDSDARRLYLRGLQLMEDRDPESLRKARTYLQGAITRNPSYAMAHSGLAECYGRLGMANILPREEALRLAQASVRKALELEPQQGEAHGASAFLKLHYALDWSGAEQEYRLALGLSPRQAALHRGFGTLLAYLGRWEESQTHFRTALELEPLSRAGRTGYAALLHAEGRATEALEEFSKVLDQDPDSLETLFRLREVLEDLGRIQDALAISDRLADLHAIPEQEASALRTAYDLRRLQGYRTERVRRLEQDPATDPVKLAEAVAQLGDKERALRLLARAVRQGSLLTVRIPRSPAFRSLREEPAFRELLRLMGYPAA